MKKIIVLFMVAALFLAFGCTYSTNPNDFSGSSTLNNDSGTGNHTGDNSDMPPPFPDEGQSGGSGDINDGPPVLPSG